jgi:hypothetical protein
MARMGSTTTLPWLLLALAPGLLPLSAEVTVPSGFSSEVIASGLSGATAMAVSPDGRIFICEQEGSLRVVKDAEFLPRPFVRLKVDSQWERGLIGVTLDPGFQANGLVYVCYVAPEPTVHHRISRFLTRGDAAVEGSEEVLFEGDDQATLGGEVPAGHQGGALHFGRDGKLYATIGDQTAGAPSQKLDSLLGKVLRLNADGSIPADNPFHDTAAGKYRAIWALGCRNPFTFAIQPGSGRMFLNDVGGAREEINEGKAGANFGWPIVEHGERGGESFTGPIHSYPVSSITGGDFLGPPPFRILVLAPAARSTCDGEAGLEALKELAARNGFAVEVAAGAVTAEALAGAAAVVLLGPVPSLGAKGRRAVEERVDRGGGLVLVHGALGSPADWPWLARASGARASGDCSSVREATCRAGDREHLSTASLPETWTWVDAWLEVEGGLAPGSRVLVSREGRPVSWCRESGAGRVWCTTLGHGREAWSRRILRDHILGGIQYAAGTVPSPIARSFPGEYQGNLVRMRDRHRVPPGPSRAERDAAQLAPRALRAVTFTSDQGIGSTSPPSMSRDRRAISSSHASAAPTSGSPSSVASRRSARRSRSFPGKRSASSRSSFGSLFIRSSYLAP